MSSPAVRWGSLVGRAVSGLIVVALVAACGAGDDDPVTSDGPTTSTAWPPLLEVAANVQSIDRVVDERHLAITIELPTGDRPECHATVIDRSKEHDVGAEPPIRPRVVLSRSDGKGIVAHADGTWPGCTIEARPVQIEIAHPHAGRSVIADHGSTPSLWVPAGDGTFRRCELPGCDPQTGQPPDPSGCDHTLVDAVRAGDVPKRSDIHVQGCEGGYAVVDIDLGSGACPPSEGEPNPCAGERVDRTFWMMRDGQWELITFGLRHTPGCANAEVPADFPLHLCEGLPPAVP